MTTASGLFAVFAFSHMSARTFFFGVAKLREPKIMRRRRREEHRLGFEVDTARLQSFMRAMSRSLRKFPR
jgi:hypothetical protein